MRILVLENDASTAAALERVFAAHGMVVDTTDQGEDGLEMAKLYDYNAVVLELLLPDIDGYEVLRRMRAAKVRTPVIVCSGLGELDHKIKALGFGADDYVTKPFDRRELLARVQAVIRRSNGHAEPKLRAWDLELDTRERLVMVGGKPFHVTAKEYSILELLLLRRSVTLTKEQFLNHLYGGMDEPELKIIDVFICKLRKKLTAAGWPGTRIETVWGRGYRVRHQEQEQALATEPARLVANGPAVPPRPPKPPAAPPPQQELPKLANGANGHAAPLDELMDGRPLHEIPKEREREVIEETLKATRGNTSRAALRLGVEWHKFCAVMKRHGLERSASWR